MESDFDSITKSDIHSQIPHPKSSILAMAALLESFSIREYAFRTRSADVGKCWPFDGVAGGRLPPIQIRKFRWWCDELDSAQSRDEPTAARSGRAKQKPTKKRSIVELFAAVPPVEERKEKRTKRILIKYEKKKKKKNGMGIKKGKIHKPKVSADRSLLQDLILKKQFKKTLMALSCKRMKKSQSPKSLPSKSNGTNIQTLKLSSNKQVVAKALPTHGILKKPNRVTSTKKRSVFHDRQGENLLESCRALVKHVTFSGKDDILGHNSHLELPPLRTLCEIFSNVLGPSSATNNSRKVDKRSHDTDGDQLVNKGDKDIADDIVEETAKSSDSHNHETTSITPKKRNCVSLEETPLGKIVDLNTPLQLSGDFDCSYSGNTRVPSSICEEGVNAGGVNGNGHNSAANITEKFLSSIESCVSSSVPTCSLNITRNTSQAPTSCLVTSMHRNGKQSRLCVGPMLDYISRIPDLQRKARFSSNDIMSSISSSVGSNTYRELGCSSDNVPNHPDKGINKDFIGLPLNSQGELMKCSSRKCGFRNLMKKQNTAVRSLHDFEVPNTSDPKCNKDVGNMKVKWFPEQHCPASQQLGSGFCIAGMQNADRRQIQRHGSMKDQYQSTHCNPDPRYGCLDHYQTLISDGEMFRAEVNLDRNQPVNPPTMRLMGKNVTVCTISNGCQDFPEGSMCREKEIVTEQCSLLRLSDKLHHKRWPQQQCVAQSSPGTSKEIIFQQLEDPGTIRFSAIRPCCEQMPFGYHMPFDCREQWMSNNRRFDDHVFEAFHNAGRGVGRSWDRMQGGQPKNGPYSQKHWMSNSAVSPTNGIYYHHPALHSATSKYMFNFNSATEPVEIGHQVPGVASHARDVYQHILQSPNNCEHRGNLPYSASSIVCPPFANQGHGNFVSPLMAPSSSNLPPWLLKPEEHRKIQNNFCPYSDQRARHKPCAVATTSILPVPSPYPTSTFTFPLHHTNAVFSPDPVLVSEPSPVPPYPTNNAYSIVNASNRSTITEKNDTQSKLKYVKDQEKTDKSRKRHADRSDGFMRPMKKSNQTVHRNSYAPIEARRELHPNIPYYAESPKQLGSGYKTMNVGQPIASSGKAPLRSSSKFSSLELDGKLKLGPVKLSSGAKHILKPCQSTNEDNSRLIHSTVPFGFGSSSSKVPVSLEKSTKIYRF